MRNILCFLVPVLSFTACYSQQPPSNATPSDPNGRNQPYSWAPNSQVTVYIDSFSFPPGSASAQAVMTGFALDAAAYSAQNISYNFVQTQNSVSLAGTYNVAYVTSVPQSVLDQNDSGYGNNYQNYHYDSSLGYNVVDNSNVVLSGDIINNTTQTTHFSAHEESHNNFEGDCFDCEDADGQSTSVMDENANIDDPNLLQGPTDEDISTFDDFGGIGEGGCDKHYCYAPVN